jgi:hypothetical protein
MDDFVGFAIAVVIIVAVAALIVAGLAMVGVLAVLVGMGYLIFLIAKAFFAYFEQIQKEEARARLKAAEGQKTLALKMAEEAQRQEMLRQELAKEQERQRQEDERLQQERTRQAQEQTARQRLEAERDQADRVVPWNNLYIQKPTGEQIHAIIEAGACVQSRSGRFIHAMVVVGPNGVAIEWKAHVGTGIVPQVIGLRGNEEMFSEWAFGGRHTARLSPGRYTLSFLVNQSGKPQEGIFDFSFEIFVPTQQAAVGSLEAFKKSVDAAASEFIDRAQTVAQAKRKVSEALTSQYDDPDEALVEMAKLDVALKDLQQEPE